MDNAQYFLDSMDRIRAPDWTPTEKDMFNMRIRTTGVLEASFTFGGQKFAVLDVGGQRNERRKWIRHFDNVDAVLFVVSIADFDMQLFEDRSINRFVETTTLWRTVLENQTFLQIPILLVLNKVDLFEEKVALGLFQKFFIEDFPDPSTVSLETAKKYMEGRFKKIFDDVNDKLPDGVRGKRRTFTHFACATNKDSSKFVFEAISKDLHHGGTATPNGAAQPPPNSSNGSSSSVNSQTKS